MPFHPAQRIVRIREWFRRHSVGSGIGSAILATAAIVAILNGLPDLFDKNLPWLGNKLNVGPFVATIWQLAWIVPLVVALGLLIGIFRNSRAIGPGPEPHPLPGHDLVGFGRDWVRCRCGWTGSGPVSKLHQSGDPVVSTNQPVDPPLVPDRAALADLTTAAWQELVDNRDLRWSTLNAEARSNALRRWGHQWEIKVERALAGDETTLDDFKHDVNTKQMDHRETPAFTLDAKLRLLRDYIPLPLQVEMNLQERWDTKGEQPPRTPIAHLLETPNADGMPQRQPPAADASRSLHPEIRVALSKTTDGITLTVMNDGPVREFRAEVACIASEHFRDDVERTDWPWPIAWHNAHDAEIVKIGPAGQAALSLVRFDRVGSVTQLASRGGFAFVFPGPKEQVRVHGRLGISTMDELKAERLTVTVRLYRLGASEVCVEHKLCISYEGPAEWCE